MAGHAYPKDKQGHYDLEPAAKVLPNGISLTTLRDLWSEFGDHPMPKEEAFRHARRLHRTVGATMHIYTVLRAMYKDTVYARKTYTGWINAVTKADEDYIFGRAWDTADNGFETKESSLEYDRAVSASDEDFEMPESSLAVLQDIRSLLMYQAILFRKAWGTDMPAYAVWRHNLTQEDEDD